MGFIQIRTNITPGEAPFGGRLVKGIIYHNFILPGWPAIYISAKAHHTTIFQHVTPAILLKRNFSPISFIVSNINR